MNTTVKVKLFENNNKWMPTKANPSDSGYDLRARAVRVVSPVTSEMMIVPLANGSYFLQPRFRVLVMTGVFTEINEGFEAQIRARSGLALKHGIGVLNGPGTIDAGYRNEYGVILINHGEQQFEIKEGDRIAQMVIAELPTVGMFVVQELTDTDRGLGGFGSTGTK